MSKRKKNIVLENLTVLSVAAEGKAIAKSSEGQVIFIEYAVPGDVVDVRLTVKKKNYMEGRIIRLISPSPHRLEPVCEHFGICGGCKWQILPYSMQLEAKERQVYDQLTRIGHLELPEIRPIIASDKTEYYRNKLEFSASDSRWILPEEDPEHISPTEKMALGFHVPKFFDKILDIKECKLQREPSNALRLFIKEYAINNGISFYNVREHSGILRNIFIRTTEDGQLMLILCFSRDFDKRESMLNAITKKFTSITSLFYIINDKLNDSISDRECILYKGKEVICERMEDLSFRIGPKTFYQTNNSQALKLYQTVREFAALQGHEIVYDLYTGAGTIALFLSKNARKVIGIEYVPEAIEDAKANAKANGIENCEFFAGDMKEVLTSEFMEIHGHPEVLITDPPRAGMHADVIKTILKVSPKKIVYVSCNPASQARDLELLCQDYKITAVQPVDMFPHTAHVENCVLLERKAKV